MPHSDSDDEERNLLGTGASPSSTAAAAKASIARGRASLFDPDDDGSRSSSNNGVGLDRLHQQQQQQQQQPYASSSGGSHGYAPTPIHTQIHPSSSGSSGSAGYAGSGSGSGSGRSLGAVHFAALAAYWFGWSFLWLPLLIVIIPFQVLTLAPHQSKGSALGSTLLLGSFVSLFCAPLFGSWSDSSRHPMGRRRPYMLCGLAICSVALLMMSLSTTLGWFSTGFLLLSVGNNCILAPYSALFPDVIPMDQRGTASGWLGFGSMLGYLFGGVCAYFLENVGQGMCYAILGTIHALCMFVTCYFIHEVPIGSGAGYGDVDGISSAGGDASSSFVVLAPTGWRPRCTSFLTPFHNHDFRILFFTRFLMQMGILTVQEYLQYYLQDAIGPVFAVGGHIVAVSPQKAVSILFLPVLFGAIVSSLCAGVISDMLGGKRKLIVYLSGALMAFSCVCFGLTRSFGLDLVLGAIFGVGFGAFSTMDWAMATDVLPHVRAETEQATRAQAHGRERRARACVTLADCTLCSLLSPVCPCTAPRVRKGHGNLELSSRSAPSARDAPRGVPARLGARYLARSHAGIHGYLPALGGLLCAGNLFRQVPRGGGVKQPRASRQGEPATAAISVHATGHRTSPFARCSCSIF